MQSRKTWPYTKPSSHFLPDFKLKTGLENKTDSWFGVVREGNAKKRKKHFKTVKIKTAKKTADLFLNFCIINLSKRRHKKNLF